MTQSKIATEADKRERNQRRNIRHFLRRKIGDPIRGMSGSHQKTADFSLVENKSLRINKVTPYIFIGASSLIFFIFFSMIGFVSSATVKTNEFELTHVWKYLTELDAELTLELKTTEKPILVNDRVVTSNEVVIRTDIDEVLVYLDLAYGDYRLDTPDGLKETIKELHQQLWQIDSKEEQVKVMSRPLSQVITWTPEWQERRQLLAEIGLYASLTELSNPLKEEDSVRITQRFGYYATDREKRLFEGIVIQTEPNEILVAAIGGDITRDQENVTITTNHQKITYHDVVITATEGQTVSKGEEIGRVKQDELHLSYHKKGDTVNPAFYFPNVIDNDQGLFDSSGIGTTFNEQKFREVILLHCHAFSNQAETIIQAAKDNGISPIVLAAIMIHETAWGTSKGIREKNNPGGLMRENELLSYPTLEEGIAATARTLNQLIVVQRLLTVEQLGSVYCPVGASNDPLGLNQYWVPTIKELFVQLGGSKDMSLLWQADHTLGQQVLAQARTLYRKNVQYSQGFERGTFPYHDCSSFVFWAMRGVGLPVQLGSTETLYSLEGTLLMPISREDVRAGDLFVWGKKGHSLGSYGHTGIFLDEGGKTILHCTPATSRGYGQEGDIVITPFEGYAGDFQLAPVYFYRLMGEIK
ncbi:peptidoglycan amidohydrolase family protein [Candidatus Enterococcus mangumiae]|uniref:NlpC/P60 domain-containing protein n=1 Tax=Candidatus Enterococcus mangumiae TaxID=2230878 RepID=A0ABZ2STK4_9ENTE|nr:peptidoglycan amidohydrolase family protein [Enterococcus sp. DIV1094]MBO0489563.1 glucosaminidase domain-containing protein [Enterococcus sp. DIV1094]